MEKLRKKITHPQGVLHLQGAQKKFSLSRYFPSEELAFFVEHHWVATWNLPYGESYCQDILSSPSVNITFDHKQAQVYGVVKRKFSYLLQGQGCIVAVKFHPGGFYPFLRASVSTLTNRILDLQEVLGTTGLLWKQEEEDALSQEEKVSRVEAFLLQRVPTRDEGVTLIRNTIAKISLDNKILSVEDVAQKTLLSTRTLQRLFARYVGVNPKWVIQMYRLQQAAERMAQGEKIQWAQLALDLGYSDQAHFIHHFTAVVGCSPTAYITRIQQNQ